MKEDQTIMPDFDEWAKVIIDSHKDLINPDSSIPGKDVLLTKISHELYDSFTKGYSLGKRIGGKSVNIS